MSSPGVSVVIATPVTAASASIEISSSPEAIDDHPVAGNTQNQGGGTCPRSASSTITPMSPSMCLMHGKRLTDLPSRQYDFREERLTSGSTRVSLGRPEPPRALGTITSLEVSHGTV